MTKPRLVCRSGTWCVETPLGPMAENYWALHEAAIAWSLERWKESKWQSMTTSNACAPAT